jgi:ATP-dependent Lhr-like helicase
VPGDFLPLEKFHPVIRSWFLEQYKKPSPPQKKGWPTISEGNHTLILAPTGSGKTLAAFLWCIDELFRSGLKLDSRTFNENPTGVHTLYISPLKALNNDIQRNLKQPLHDISQKAKEMDLYAPNIRVMVRTGDTPSNIRQSMVRTPPHILITTPESFYLLLTSLRGREILRNIKYLIADEIHAISNNKRGVHFSLSMERLMALNQAEPVRIGLSATQRPLDRIAAFLGGQLYIAQTNSFKARPVTIIDCGQNKSMDLKVISPVKSFSDLPESTVWPMVIKQIYDLIQSHRTTLVFVNMRAQTEKIARQLNELHQQKSANPEAILAYSHHGSMSREMRFEIEEKLKNGKISAVIATASLELGIDIGSIDLVLQLEAPKSVSAALQRVGRSGHLLSCTSKGRIIPLYPSDLDDALALVRCAKEGDIEETFIPENCLDVLAQQILAEVSVRNWSREDLYNLFKQSYCYRHLTSMTFDKTVEMLSGAVSESKLPALQARITWDKVNDKLIARRGANLIAIMNGGTIPDRGYYTVTLRDGNIRLGEVEEEFVFESRIGDVFFLGNSEWLIESITQDRILVSPYKSVKPRAPFWKGEIPFRDYYTSEKIAQFRNILSVDKSESNIKNTLLKHYYCDEESAQNLIDYFKRQKALTGSIPTQHQIGLEYFHGTAGEVNLVVHAPFGGRITAAWAMALSRAITQELGVEIQFAFNDDGFLLRILETVEELNLEKFLKIPAHEIEKILLEALPNSPLFAIHFRYNAARALLLTRSRPGRRIPLWLQRLHAADLLQAVRRYPDFPIILETYRTCLQDYFDLANLLKIINKINREEIRLQYAHTPYPSPMSSGLLFNFLSSQMYDYDHTRTSGEVAGVSSVLLAQILSQEQIPAIVNIDMVQQAQDRWQHLTDESRAADQEDLFVIIEKLGPLHDVELQQRSKGNIKPWLEKLAGENRIIRMAQGWLTASHIDTYTTPLSLEKAEQILRRFLNVHGPVKRTLIQEQLNIPEELLNEVLKSMLNAKDIICGPVIKDSREEYLCDSDRFAELYRMAISQRRKSKLAVNRNAYIKFLLKWHEFGNMQQNIYEIIERYRGVRFAPYLFEREIMRSRLFQNDTSILQQKLVNLKDIINDGEIIAQCYQEDKGKRAQLYFNIRGQGTIWDKSIIDDHILAGLSENDETVYQCLKENGASFALDIEDATALSSTQLFASLGHLVHKGIVTCDDYDTLLSVLHSETSIPVKSTFSSTYPQQASYRRPQVSRRMIREKVSQQMQIKSGRWFLTSSFAVMGKSLDHSIRAEKQARILLQRYGIVVKEWYRREQGFLPWYQIFQILKRLEWQGEILRGYFIKGLSGIQFALPRAVDLLEKINSGEISTIAPVMISTIDPALPFGGYVEWDLYNSQNKKISIVRNPGNHIIFIQGQAVCYSENYATQICTLKSFQKSMLEEIIRQIKSIMLLPTYLRPRKRIEIEFIDHDIAPNSQYGKKFISNGFEREGEKLVLWPSGL